jgi:hypothetical protein
VNAPVQIQFSDKHGFSVSMQPIRVQAGGTVVAAVPIYIDPVTGETAQGSVSLTLAQGDSRLRRPP